MVLGFSYQREPVWELLNVGEPKVQAQWLRFGI